MKAARFYGPKDIRVEEIPEIEPEAGQVKIKIAWNGICGSDLHEYLAGPLAIPKTPHPTTGEKLPITMGHEFSGTIVALGKDVDGSKYAVGSNAIVEPILDCSRKDCPACTRGTHNLCTSLGIIGFSGGGGGLSTYFTISTKYVHIIPENIPLDIAACLEPLAVAWYAIKRANYKRGDKCLIVGGGPIGLFVLKVLKSFGCDWVAVSEPAAVRREKALKLGADLALNPLSVDVVTEVLTCTKGLGVDIAFECAGMQASFDVAIASTKPRGLIMNVALWGGPSTLNMNQILLGTVARLGTPDQCKMHLIS